MPIYGKEALNICNYIRSFAERRTSHGRTLLRNGHSIAVPVTYKPCNFKPPISGQSDMVPRESFSGRFDVTRGSVFYGADNILRQYINLFKQQKV